MSTLSPEESIPASIPHFSMQRQVAFKDTDMAGFVHFSNFFAYMEEAEAAFFQSLGFELVRKEVDSFYGWPKVRAQCAYLSPLRFPDQFRIQMCVEAVKVRALEYSFRFYKQEPFSQEGLVAKGKLVTLHARFALNCQQEVEGCSLQDAFLAALEPYRLDRPRG